MYTIPAALLAAALAASGPIYPGVDRNLRVSIPRLDAAAEIDGHLTEPMWEQAARLTGFSQYAPNDGRPAADETEVRVWYSPTAIYFGIRAQAAPGSVRATLADRDHVDNDDLIQIYLSTFNDSRQATVIGVNPLGVQLDGAAVEGARQGGGGFSGLAVGRPGTDLSPDFVYESKGRLTDEGYEVEVRLPFKSLRYQPALSQDWGLHIVRRVQSSGHDDSWAPARRSEASFLGQSGTLVGLTDLRRGLVMDLNPFATARADGRDDAGTWLYDRHRPEAGANVRWGVTPSLTFNGTVNPDFSQVEADATQFQIGGCTTISPPGGARSSASGIRTRISSSGEGGTRARQCSSSGTATTRRSTATTACSTAPPCGRLSGRSCRTSITSCRSTRRACTACR